MKALLLILALSACTASGQQFTAESLDDKKPHLVVYRPPGYGAAAADWSIHINGKNCDLNYGSYWQIDGLDGPVNITADHWGSPGTTRLTVDTSTQRVTYVKIEIDTAKSSMAVLGGVVGYLAAEGISKSGGPYTLTEVDHSLAEAEISTLKRDCL